MDMVATRDNSYIPAYAMATLSASPFRLGIPIHADPLINSRESGACLGNQLSERI